MGEGGGQGDEQQYRTANRSEGKGMLGGMRGGTARQKEEDKETRTKTGSEERRDKVREMKHACDQSEMQAPGVEKARPLIHGTLSPPPSRSLVSSLLFFASLYPPTLSLSLSSPPLV